MDDTAEKENMGGNVVIVKDEAKLGLDINSILGDNQRSSLRSSFCKALSSHCQHSNTSLRWSSRTEHGLSGSGCVRIASFAEQLRRRT